MENTKLINTIALKAYVELKEFKDQGEWNRAILFILQELMVENKYKEFEIGINNVDLSNLFYGYIGEYDKLGINEYTARDIVENTLETLNEYTIEEVE